MSTGHPWIIGGGHHLSSLTSVSCHTITHGIGGTRNHNGTVAATAGGLMHRVIRGTIDKAHLLRDTLGEIGVMEKDLIRVKIQNINPRKKVGLANLGTVEIKVKILKIVTVVCQENLITRETIPLTGDAADILTGIIRHTEGTGRGKKAAISTAENTHLQNEAGLVMEEIEAARTRGGHGLVLDQENGTAAHHLLRRGRESLDLSGASPTLMMGVEIPAMSKPL